MRASMEALMGRTPSASPTSIAADEAAGIRCTEGSTTAGHSHDRQDANSLRRAPRLARVVIPGFCIPRIGESQVVQELQRAAMEETPITAESEKKLHRRQLYVALALLCRGSALVTVTTNTEVNNGLEALRGLNAAYGSDNKGLPRIRIQHQLQPKRSDAVARTTNLGQRWECDV